MEVVALESHRIDRATRTDLRELWARAFGDRFSDDDAAHAYGGVHVLVRDDGGLVAHASSVPRAPTVPPARSRTTSTVG